MGATLGLSAKLYCLDVDSVGPRETWGTLDTATGVTAGVGQGADLTEVRDVKDITIPVEFGEGDATTRRSGGYEQVITTLGKVSIDIPMLWLANPDAADPLALFLKACHTRTVLPLLFADGVATTDGTQGLWADFSVIKQEKGEPLDGVQMITFTVKLGPSSVPPERILVDNP